MILVGRAMQAVEAKLMKIDRTILMIYAGVLARYDQMGLLSRLAEKVGRPGGIPGLWLLLPGEQPLLDGKSVPLLGPGQRGLIPTSWLENRHRANGNSVAL